MKVLASGKCGADVTWTLTDDAVLTISGTGPMDYFHTPPIEGYNGPEAPWYMNGSYVAIREVVIESGVTSIGGYAFYSCHNLTKVTIPESVTVISEYAFTYCRKLSRITIPASVKKIGQRAFECCFGLTSITFLGDAPSMESPCFEEVTATVYSPCTKSWDSKVIKNDSETLTWAGHVYSDYAITRDATCTENAQAVGTCPDCGATADITVPESATGHCFDQNGRCTTCSEQIGLTIDICVRSDNWFDEASLYVYANGKYLDAVTWAMYSTSNPLPYRSLPYSPHITYTFVWDETPTYGHVFFAIFLGEKVLTCGYPKDADIGKVFYTLWRTENHQYETVTTPPTCTAQGSTANVCTACGASTTISIIPATGHSYTSEVTTAPTCNEEGVRTFFCCACGSSYTEVTPAIWHCYDAEGLCVDCGVKFKLSIYMTDTYGDSWNGSAIQVYTGDTVLTEVSLSDGTLNGEVEIPYIPGQTYQLKWKSGVADDECGLKIALSGETLAAGQGSDYSDGQLLCIFTNVCDHVLSGVTVISPTCTEDGYTTGICTVCGYSSILDTTPATGHSYADGVCTVCQHTELLDSGSCGENLQWRLDVFGTLTITGTGPMTDYSADSNAPWYKKLDSIKKIKIGEGVTTIGNRAFQGCTGLTDVTIPESVTTIGIAAFYLCKNLNGVTIPGGVTRIDGYAFKDCTGLTSIRFSGQVPYMDSTCFRSVTATAVYPCNDQLWTDAVKQNYGGTITWEADHHDENGICTGCGEGRMPGDLNGDGQRDIVDVARLYAHIKGTIPLDSTSLSYADVIGDGSVDIADIARLYAHAKGTKPLN